MCDGYVKIQHKDDAGNVPLQEVGMWGNSGDFTIEMLVTPYDVNGNADAPTYSASIKSLSRHTKGAAYLPTANRHDVEMVLFHNTNLTISLVNTTTDAFYQPAEYAVKVSITIGTTTTSVTSDTVISATRVDDNHFNSQSSSYVYDGHTPVAHKSALTVSSISTNVITLSGTASGFGIGQTIYTSAGLLVGTITNVSGADITMDGISNTPSGYVYQELPKDSAYVEVPHHIAVSYRNSGKMSIFYNGNLVKDGVHGAGGSFSLDPSDVYLGQNPNAGSYQTIRKSQFMGEFHEISMVSKYKSAFRSINSLMPNYRDLLLYLDFEEANLDG
tara:strand:- start:1849 stop:2838 length:990 start_codon:yes stop_codon:yes gene_type:complete